jgi:hypothetical protein
VHLDDHISTCLIRPQCSSRINSAVTHDDDFSTLKENGKICVTMKSAAVVLLPFLLLPAPAASRVQILQRLPTP